MFLSEVFWRVSNLFLTITVYLFLIPPLESEDQCGLTIYVLFLCRLMTIIAKMILSSEDAFSKYDSVAMMVDYFYYLVWLSHKFFS